MKHKLGHLTTVLVLLAVLAPMAAAEEWTIDPSHSAAQFAVKHMMVSTVRGHFGKMSGTVNFDPADPTAAKVVAEVDIASIDTRNAKRDDHLRGADFFEVEKFPTMKFESTNIEKAGMGLKMTGNLTLKGVTKEVVFDVEGPANPVASRRGMKSGASATTTISRKEFGMTWNRAIEAGGVTVGDEVQITIDVELNSGGGGGGQRQRPQQ
jgi:polyisoprenoid-binding protein YceI